MADLKSTLTETLRAHRPTTKRVPHPKGRGILLNLHACTGCEWTEQDGGDHTEHVADVLLGLSGVAVTALPEPQHRIGGSPVWSVNLGGEGESVYIGPKGCVTISGYTTFDERDIPGLVPALLAAAAAAVVSEGSGE
ncbi:hypothetical protein SAMN04488581_2631 [Mycolicibacterium neoaurum]|uniref:hypothetical protein n=1 Tax=Mycolicibacterium neoaurum TaxID=1795 RepID=UPI00068EF12C|nr:hypothetical protein [Mycolicibacterium neoaurum]SDD59957.1 hypothetical protein SAMN04488581_2631 [Mycolicibacterium neoaurum]